MRETFREHHLFNILDSFESQNARLPLDRFLSDYFRSHKAIGSKDRKEICTILYAMIRWRGLLDHFSSHPLSWRSRYQTYSSYVWQKGQNDPSIPQHVRCSFPKAFFQFLVTSLGEEQALLYAHISNSPAPTTVRINPALTSRDALLKRWSTLYDVSAATHSKQGIVFHKKINFFALDEFKEGLFEIQDEGSQLLADLVDVQPGDQVLDFCSGSGGKTLAFAHKMKSKGQIYLHDIRASILKEAKKRLSRSQIQNAQFLLYDDPKKKTLKGKMDWVLVDAPCSGSGTLRRNPDMKWKFSEEHIVNLIELQKKIFEEALTFLKPNGRIIYATCSVFPQENEDQIAYFKDNYLLIEGKRHHTFPQEHGMDGFFGVTLCR
jgi:16S rRNA C967 or C1407 C5-methylase (RsmB/RsmF family)